MRFLCLPRHNHINQFGLSKQGHAQMVATNFKQRRMYNLTMSYGSSFIDLINLILEAIHTSTHDDSSGTAKETSDKITRKTRNETRQARAHTWASDTSTKFKSLQDLSIRVNPKVTEEVMHHAGL
jgi:dihydrodipicolinate reductase